MVTARELGAEVAGHLLEALGSLGAGQGRMSAERVAELQHVPDDVRWGDAKYVTVPSGALAVNVQHPTTQIVRVNGRRPRAWILTLVVEVPSGLAAESTQTLSGQWQVIVGVGSASVTLRYPFTVSVASLAASGNQLVVQSTVASKDLQIAATVKADAALVQDEQVTFTALAAPLID